MAFSEALLAHVRHFEGWSAVPYRDPGGIPTIGYGHVIPSMEHPPITREAGEVILQADLEIARRLMLASFPAIAEASPRRQEAMIDMVFNLGAGKLRGSGLARAIEARDWAEAARQMRRWVYGRKWIDGKKVMVRLPGLVRRREAVATWMEEG